MGIVAGSSLERLQRIRRMAETPSLLKLYLILPDEGGSSESLISHLGEIFDVVSQVNPRLVAVPLLPWAGWNSVESISSLDFSALSDGGSESVAVSDEKGRRRALVELSHPPLSSHLLSPPTLQFKHVAMGGTFDRLHSGHMLLLATAALVTSHTLYIGITSDALLANKAHARLLQPYPEREESALRYVHEVRPSLNVITGQLRDPNEPTAAELSPEMEAIVVSLETQPGAQRINEGRRARGLNQLQVITVGLVGGSGPDKLSSSGLREKDEKTS